MSDTETATEPKIYVACLAAYNAGKLHGAWVDAAQEPEEIHAEIAEMLKASPELDAEEWTIHDSEGFGAIKISENESIEDVSKWGLGIEEHGEAFGIYVGMVGDEYASLENFEEAYCGEHSSEKEFAQSEMDGIWDIPKFLEYYIDWEAVARDLFINDYYEEGGHVFRRI